MLAPKISVITPHYNSPDTLERLIKSVFEQDDDIEMIIVDDLSTDYLEEYESVKQKYESSKIHFFSNDSGIKGPGASRNLGIEKALGEWIVFADADDYMATGWFNIVKSHFDSTSDAVFFSPSSINIRTNSEGTRHLPYKKLVSKYNPHERSCDVRIRYLFNSPCSKMVKRKLLNEYNIRFETIMHGEDTMPSIQIGYHMNEYEVDDRVIYYITETPNSMTNNMSWEAFYLRASVFCRKYKFVESKLSKDDFSILGWKANPMKRLVRVIQRRYGLKSFFSLISLYRKNKIKIFNKDGINFLIKGIFRKHSAENGD